jgi:hypothetical protein
MSGWGFDLGNSDKDISEVPGIVIIDAKAIYDTLNSQNQPLQLAEKRTALELLAYLRNTERNGTETRWVHGEANLGDGMTKLGAAQMLWEFMLTSTWSLVFDPEQKSGKKRKAIGLDKLANKESDFVVKAWEKLLMMWPAFDDRDQSSEED